ncbi:transposase [Rhizobium sp. N4311]|uniref:transposase n=1 Tax=Rhizobium sp. N4311 TaxID=1703972 RepID=UPI000B95F579|nr:transposase [Rhizobium sp. N4311]OYD00488.1 IS1182 family insertion sequence transposase protein [Rhizobium sp. N4311]
MMGCQTAPAQLFYDFCLDDHVPTDHLLRGIDRHLELDSVRTQLKPFYSATGRPSIDPELMMRMLIISYSMGIRSERRLCEEVHLNLAYRWFCRLGLDGKVPDHSSFSKNRHGRFRQSDILRLMFETLVERCLAQGLAGADGFAVDASLIAADANKQRSVAGAEWEAKEDAGRSVKEYLAVLDDAAFGAASPVTPQFISPSDPAAQWTGAHKGHAFFAYATNYLIDTDHGVILDVEATRAIRQAEVGASRMMLDQTESRFGLRPGYLAADSAYGSADNLAWLVKEKKIAPHIPVFDKSKRTDGTFSRSDFSWEAENDRYICPAGKELKQFHRTYATPRSGITAEGTRLYRASKKDCDRCELKPRCCPNMPMRKVPRDLNEDARDVARAIAATPEYVQSRHRRKKVEILFAHLKRILRMARLRLRGPCGARDEFLLAATAQNLRRLAKLRPQTPLSGANTA